MPKDLDALLHQIAQAAHQLVVARSETVFQEAFDEAMAESKRHLKARLLHAMMAQSTVWMEARAAEATPVDLPQSAVQSNLVQSPVATTHSVAAPAALPREEPWPEHPATVQMHAAEVEALVSERALPDQPEAPYDLVDIPEPIMLPDVAEQADVPLPPSQAITPTSSDVFDIAALTAVEATAEPIPTTDGTSIPDTSEMNGEEAEMAAPQPNDAALLKELAMIREQIDRNEQLLGQLQPFLNASE